MSVGTIDTCLKMNSSMEDIGIECSYTVSRRCSRKSGALVSICNSWKGVPMGILWWQEWKLG